jgi:hypothetical protein
MRFHRLISLALLALLLVGVTAWLLRTQRATATRHDQLATTSQPPGRAAHSFHRLPRLATDAEQPATEASEAPPETATNFLQRLLAENATMSEAACAQIAPWLARNRTNAESLLAVRQAGGGQEYLLTALTNFPHDPRVLFGALALNDSAEAQRERFDRFKAAAPENALVDYLSARDHLKHGRPAEALSDLTAAAQKSHFQEYLLDAMQNCEEFHLAAGKSPLEAKALACSTALLPHLAQLKGLAGDLATLQRQYLAAGDAASAENLALYGLQLSQHLTAGEGSRTLIGQLVGVATAQIVLNPLNSEPYRNQLQGTVQDRLASLTAQKAAFRQDWKTAEQWLETASEADLGNYFERQKLYGEAGAIAWAKQRPAGQ